MTNRYANRPYTAPRGYVRMSQGHPQNLGLLETMAAANPEAAIHCTNLKTVDNWGSKIACTDVDNPLLRTLAYWDFSFSGTTAPVICVDVDNKDAGHRAFNTMLADGFMMPPSIVIVNPHNHHTQLMWIMDRCYANEDKERKAQFWSIQRSLVNMLHADIAFRHARMRNPYCDNQQYVLDYETYRNTPVTASSPSHIPIKDVGQHVYLYHNRMVRYSLDALQTELERVHGYITGKSISNRYRMRRTISKNVKDALRERNDMPTKMQYVVDDFVPNGRIAVGERNNVAYRQCFAAYMNGISPDAVMRRMRFDQSQDDSFTKKDRDAIVRGVIRAGDRKRRYYNTNAISRQRLDYTDENLVDNDYKVRYDVMWRDNKRGNRGRGHSSLASRIARDFGIRGAASNTRLQTETRRSNCGRGTNQRIINHADYRTLIYKHVMNDDKGVMTYRIIARNIRSINHQVTPHKHYACEQACRKTCYEIRDLAITWLINHNVKYRYIRRVMDRQDTPIRALRALLRLANGHGFGDAMDAVPPLSTRRQTMNAIYALALRDNSRHGRAEHADDDGTAQASDDNWLTVLFENDGTTF